MERGDQLTQDYSWVELVDEFSLSQIVRQTTRGIYTLDLVLTNSPA